MTKNNDLTGRSNHNSYLNVKLDIASGWIHFKYKTFTSILDVQTNGQENVYSSPPLTDYCGFFHTLKDKYLTLSDLALKTQAGVPGYLRTTNNMFGKIRN